MKQNGKWYFDSKAGRDEIQFRRIGANELDAIEICRGFVDAQKEDALEQHDDSNVNQFAQRIISTPGKHDGLAWQGPNGALQQGPAAALGEIDFLVEGAMIGEFALAATPA